MAQSPPPSAQPVMGVATSAAAQRAYAAPPYPPATAMATGAPATSQHQLAAYQQVQQFHHHRHHQLRAFWTNQMVEIEQTTDFKNHSLPLARIKKIMKADKDVRMISSEAPVVFAKACEIFILELTLRSWIHTEENKRRTLLKNDIATAITRTDIFDFLVDIVPRDELQENDLGISRLAAEPVPYYYMPAQRQVVAGPGMVMGKAVDQTAAAMMYTAPQARPVAYVWPQPANQQQQMPGSES